MSIANSAVYLNGASVLPHITLRDVTMYLV